MKGLWIITALSGALAAFVGLGGVLASTGAPQEAAAAAVAVAIAVIPYCFSRACEKAGAPSSNHEAKGESSLTSEFDGGTGYRCPKCHTPVPLNATFCPGCKGAFAVRGPTTKQCPDCAEDVKIEARKCRYCGFPFAA